jgi:dipeptidyl aminopeptidase/acylaminoacyl peptidase
MPKKIALAILVIALSASGWLYWSNRQMVSQSVSNYAPAALLELASPRPTPTPSQPHPLSIEGIRQTEIAPTQLVIDQQYQDRANYTSHLAHYNSNGLRINALLTIPDQEPPTEGFPAVVFLHGYIPPDQYQTTQKYEAYVDYLAARGLVILKIDYRGHGDSEGEASGAYFSPNYVLDARAAIAALQNFDQVNPEAIGVWSHSMSGNVALRTAVTDPSVKAVVVWAGAVFSYQDREAYGLNDNSFVRNRGTSGQIFSRSRSLFEQHGEYSPDNPFWQAVAPTNYLEYLNAPIQLHHAENDAVVSVNYSKDLIPLLEEANKPVELYTYPTGGHNLTGSSFTQAMERTVEFFTTNLTSI